ncbi:hypothetical protein SISSUDRAFT_1035016 [Sistotremastrum suecicum HHB10207 ss-3]|uniref:Carboxymuconolactone decarboxylase-like domain-containing protein n=1 Tax=Sistotremastrum suecicum HHB10207 ss-3 TaxID=1314776 RepID=A0A166BBR2_9AGAM|nr:hypothetical protein SISSUDRAFT_1035016 [Sistotremastrum suecicum HHB10207 ss-3]
MSSIASPEFLTHLKNMWPSDSQRRNPWPIIAVVGFCTANRPEGVPRVFEHARQQLESDPRSDADSSELTFTLAKILREALFKGGLLSGYAKTINALRELDVVMPEHFKDTKPLRDFNQPPGQFAKNGETLFRQIYGSSATTVDGLLSQIYPDMGAFSMMVGYGMVYSCTDVLQDIETSFVLIAALIAGDTPLQIRWHLDGALRNGASEGEVRAVRRMAIEVADHAGVVRRFEVPSVEKVDAGEE